MPGIQVKDILLHRYNASLVGFANLEGLLPDEFAHLPYGISIVFRLSDAIVDTIHSAPTRLYAYHYHTVNSYLNDLALQVTNYLQKQHYQALPIPASLTINWVDHKAHLSHKMVATQSGLGWVGKNALLVTKKFGPRVRLVTVLTDAPLRTSRPMTESLCGDCQVCVKACPVGALRGNDWAPGIERATLLDVKKCADFIAQYQKDLAAPVCGICMQVCPKGMRES